MPQVKSLTKMLFYPSLLQSGIEIYEYSSAATARLKWPVIDADWSRPLDQATLIHLAWHSISTANVVIRDAGNLTGNCGIALNRCCMIIASEVDNIEARYRGALFGWRLVIS